MAALADQAQRVVVTEDAVSNSPYSTYSAVEWNITEVLYCDDPDNPFNPSTVWFVSIGHDDVNPWTGGGITFRTRDVVSIEFINTCPHITVGTR